MQALQAHGVWAGPRSGRSEGGHLELCLWSRSWGGGGAWGKWGSRAPDAPTFLGATMWRSELFLSPACIGARMVVHETLASPLAVWIVATQWLFQAIHSYPGYPAEAEMMQRG